MALCTKLSSKSSSGHGLQGGFDKEQKNTRGPRHLHRVKMIVTIIGRLGSPHRLGSSTASKAILCNEISAYVNLGR